MNWRAPHSFANHVTKGWRVILGDTAYPHKMRWHCDRGCSPTPCMDCGVGRLHGACLCTPDKFRRRERERAALWWRAA